MFSHVLTVIAGSRVEETVLFCISNAVSSSVIQALESSSSIFRCIFTTDCLYTIAFMTKLGHVFIFYGMEALEPQCIPITHAPSHDSVKAIHNEAAFAPDNLLVLT